MSVQDRGAAAGDPNLSSFRPIFHGEKSVDGRGQLLLLVIVTIPVAVLAWLSFRRHPRPAPQPEIEPAGHAELGVPIITEPEKHGWISRIRASWAAMRARWTALPVITKVGILVTGCVAVIIGALFVGASIPVLTLLATLLSLLIPLMLASAASNARSAR